MRQEEFAVESVKMIAAGEVVATEVWWYRNVNGRGAVKRRGGRYASVPGDPRGDEGPDRWKVNRLRMTG